MAAQVPGFETAASVLTKVLWRTVSSAPSNRVVIAWSGGVRLMRRDADTGQWRNMLGRPKPSPTHWMPLPEAPAADRSAA